MRHPGLEPGSTDWKSVIIPLDQWRYSINHRYQYLAQKIKIYF